ncbi:NAD-dependent epimerase/dehydratase family protein [Stappia sp. GBMRC 2046]|uniref:NAD-dependent epimerase/dehydratase family protein n=1 Tax=Stappia sediminis TaxID=2692190 RepID=A0A7X3LU91_9HYPH|nr:D-erythronate dehydrogenase [Stappia sediminis]MXN65227.1 NAD-dependent epimerase/dehydratase family protein [Stappia sediminis]
MSHVLVLGAAGMIGRKLVERLVEDGKVAGHEITRLTLADVVEPTHPPGLALPVDTHAADISAPGEAERLVAHAPDVIFHLAAIVSGEAETDFDKGYRINLDATRALLEAIRNFGGDYHPRLVFASSIAVFGAPLPERIADTFQRTPLTSYGTQKAISELLVNDYTRKGFLDGVSIRLPTIVVRPGKPNKAASGFFSGIIREPLNGEEAVLPVGTDVVHWMASPRAAVGFLMHAAELDGESIGHDRALTMPGLAVTIAEEIATLAKVAGPAKTNLIRQEPDAAIAKIIAGWPRSFDAGRALSLGFKADASFEEIVRLYIEEENIEV